MGLPEDKIGAITKEFTQEQRCNFYATDEEFESAIEVVSDAWNRFNGLAPYLDISYDLQEADTQESFQVKNVYLDTISHPYEARIGSSINFWSNDEPILNGLSDAIIMKSDNVPIINISNVVSPDGATVEVSCDKITLHSVENHFEYIVSDYPAVSGVADAINSEPSSPWEADYDTMCESFDFPHGLNRGRWILSSDGPTDIDLTVNMLSSVTYFPTTTMSGIIDTICALSPADHIGWSGEVVGSDNTMAGSLIPTSFVKSSDDCTFSTRPYAISYVYGETCASGYLALIGGEGGRIGIDGNPDENDRHYLKYWTGTQPTGDMCVENTEGSELETLGGYAGQIGSITNWSADTNANDCLISTVATNATASVYKNIRLGAGAIHPYASISGWRYGFMTNQDASMVNTMRVMVEDMISVMYIPDTCTNGVLDSCEAPSWTGSNSIASGFFDIKDSDAWSVGTGGAGGRLNTCDFVVSEHLGEIENFVASMTWLISIDATALYHIDTWEVDDGCSSGDIVSSTGVVQTIDTPSWGYLYQCSVVREDAEEYPIVGHSYEGLIDGGWKYHAWLEYSVEPFVLGCDSKQYEYDSIVYCISDDTDCSVTQDGYTFTVDMDQPGTIPNSMTGCDCAAPASDLMCTSEYGTSYFLDSDTQCGTTQGDSASCIHTINFYGYISSGGSTIMQEDTVQEGAAQ